MRRQLFRQFIFPSFAMSVKNANFVAIMRKKAYYPMMLCAVLLSALALVSCNPHKTSQGKGGGDTLQMKYAEDLTIVKHDGYTVARIADPWHKGKTLHTYVLVPDSVRTLPASLPQGTVVRTPLRRAVVSTTVHSQLFISLSAPEAIGGVCDLSYVNIPYVQQQVKAHKIADCGSSMAPDVEKMMDLKPDAVLLSPFENSGGYGKLEKTRIPIIECADYMEPSPLARAEWMKFYGLLLGKERQADSLFQEVETRYLSVKRKAQACKTRPSVLIDRREGGVWYLPGGRSTLGQMIADAGGRYILATDKTSGSVPLALEAVLDRGADADIWLVRYFGDPHFGYATLAGESAAYTQIKAYKQRHVMGCDLQTSGFYELTPFRPDLLILDFFTIFHPGQNPGQKLRFFHALQP